MKESKTKNKTVRYKKVDLKTHKTLSDYLNDVTLVEASEFYKVKSRQQSVSPNSDDFIFINHISEFKNMIYGELVVIEMGKSQQFIDLEDDASEYTIKALSTSQIKTDETTKELKREFVESVLYFGVIDNHLAVIQSRALTAKTLESYLDWLLGEAASVMDNDYNIILKDAPNLTVQEKLENSSTKKLVIGTDISTEAIQESTEVARTRYNLSNKVMQALKAFLPDDVYGCGLEDDLEDANLKLKLEMTYDRKTSECGQRVMDSVASSLRHTEDYKIVLTDGTTITADELKLSGTVSMQIIKGNVYRSGLKSTLHTWLVENVDFNS